MVTISPSSRQVIEPTLERAGQLDDGTEVFCSVVLSDAPFAETYAIIPGCGADASHYYNLQKAMAKFGLNSVCADPVYRFSKHQNRLQAQAAELAINYAKAEHGIVAEYGYGHSWGGSKLASLLHHGLPGIKVAVFHNTAGIENPIANLVSHPFASAVHYGHEITHATKHVTSKEREGKLPTILPKLGRLAVTAQHLLVASHHRKLTEHLSTVPEPDVIFVGLWADHDPLFYLRSHEAFHINRRMPGSVHTEPQSNARGVAQELVTIIDLAKNYRNSVVEATPGQFAVAGF